jgi:hypothetical protein
MGIGVPSSIAPHRGDCQEIIAGRPILPRPPGFPAPSVALWCMMWPAHETAARGPRGADRRIAPCGGTARIASSAASTRRRPARLWPSSASPRAFRGASATPRASSWPPTCGSSPAASTSSTSRARCSAAAASWRRPPGGPAARCSGPCTTSIRPGVASPGRPGPWPALWAPRRGAPASSSPPSATRPCPRSPPPGSSPRSSASPSASPSAS